MLAATYKIDIIYDSNFQLGKERHREREKVSDGTSH